MSVSAYYHHYGNDTLQYASVPFGWDAQPYFWVPGALWSHSIGKYRDVLAQSNFTSWMSDFVRTADHDYDDDDRPPNVDDDIWVDPPDDDGEEDEDIALVQIMR